LVVYFFFFFFFDFEPFDRCSDDNIMASSSATVISQSQTIAQRQTNDDMNERAVEGMKETQLRMVVDGLHLDYLLGRQ
jgi:predicted regulator of Ras-like GTPase activity (Roadblock/LC7/MglB family)